MRPQRQAVGFASIRAHLDSIPRGLAIPALRAPGLPRFPRGLLPCIRSVIVLPPDDEQKWHEQLQQMSGFTNLEISANTVAGARMVSDPLCHPKLSRLVLQGNPLPHHFPGYRASEDFSTLLWDRLWQPFSAGIAQASRLTSISFGNCTDLANKVLRVCGPRLQDLQLMDDEAVALFNPCFGLVVDALEQATNLTALRYQRRTGTPWDQILGPLARLPKLRSLGVVVVERREEAEALLALTQLTELSSVWKLSLQEGPVRDLSRLSRLEALVLWAGTDQESGTGAAIARLPQLQRLALMNERVPSGGPFPIAGLSRLTSLNLGYPVPPDDLGATLLHPWMSRLHGLTLTVGKPVEGERARPGPAVLTAVAALGSSLSKVEELTLHVHWSGVWAALVPCFTALTSLKSLDVTGPVPQGNYVPYGIGDHAWAAEMEALPRLPTITPLSRLTGLTSLSLGYALEPRNAPVDIPCLAQLTNLEELSISGWAIRPSEVPDPQELESEFVAECFKPVGVLPLANLRLLEKCCIGGLNKLRGAQSFKRKLHAVQKKMGLNAAKIVHLHLA